MKMRMALGSTALRQQRLLGGMPKTRLKFYPEVGPGETVNHAAARRTFERSRATAFLTLPSGRSRCYVNATGRQPTLQNGHR